jgi:hypothetical protein
LELRVGTGHRQVNHTDILAALSPENAPPSPPPPPPPTAPHPSPTDERLRDTIAKRMRMIHVDQPLMLMELLGHGFARQQPAQPPRRT